ncbi:hypothetical protein [Prevotella sp. B2-R-102]|uniref:hypothetical protein n=1 Tax=Segatella intestinalis TaxID=3035284 RepID=UPI0023EBF43F|nr:hypothetical protein [Prevotella sp. B2-R-102]MDF4241166.1 hypothetical protein [Prevotella sp. B2-R-102]
MKKFIYSCLFLAMAAITFSSCEDVPAPYNMPTEDETPEVQPAGTGTAADPFNVAGAVKYIEDGGSESELKYVKGKVVSVEQGSFDATHGSLKYYISDDGTPTNQFYVYNGYAGPNRTKFSGEDALKQGDEVVICGNLIVFSGTKEFQTGNYIVSLNGEGGTTTPDTPTTGKGSESDPYTVAEAIAAIKAGAPTSEVYVTGIVSDVYFYSDQYKSLSYYISDDGKSKDMQVYSGKGLNGADFTSKEDLKVGQKVTIKGIIKAFNKNGTDIMEIDKNSTIVKIEGEGTGGEVTPKPDTPDTGNGKITFADDHRTLTLENSNATAGESVSFDFTAQNYENQTDMTTIKLSDGTTITFDANGEKNGSKYYTSGTAVRVYKNNKIIVKGTKEIAKIIFHCNAPYTKNGETVNCDGNETATINFSGKTATYTNVFTGTTGGGVQLRFSSIEIVYAK